MSPLFIAAATVALSLAAFVPHAVPAWQKDVDGWDLKLSEAIHAYENRDTILDRRIDVFSVVLDPAAQVLGLLVVVATACATFALGRRRLALMVVLGVGGATLLGPVLKEIFERPPVDSPSDGEGSYSFPSGHALRSMAAACAMGLVAWTTRWRWPVIAAGAVIVLLTGVGVVYHEWHWVSDVLAGWCIAVAWLACVWFVLRPTGQHRRRWRVRGADA